MNSFLKFLLICITVVAFLVSLSAIYAVYTVDQTAKKRHYNKALRDCLSTPGAIRRYEASTPLVGSGIKMSCEHVVPYKRRKL